MHPALAPPDAGGGLGDPWQQGGLVTRARAAGGRGCCTAARAEEVTKPLHGKKGLGRGRDREPGANPQGCPAPPLAPPGCAGGCQEASVQPNPHKQPRRNRLGWAVRDRGKGSLDTARPEGPAAPAQRAPGPTSTGAFMQEGGSGNAQGPGGRGCWCCCRLALASEETRGCSRSVTG